MVNIQCLTEGFIWSAFLSVPSKLNYLFIYFSLNGILVFIPCDVYMGKLPCTLTCMLLVLIGCKKQMSKLQASDYFPFEHL